MPAISDLKTLLKAMEPKLVEGEFVFCSIPRGEAHIHLSPLLVFGEEEGVTVIVEKKAADENMLKYYGVWRMITLGVNSDLRAVGFLAKIAPRLAKKGIGVNVVSAYYHDHLFVPAEKAEEAMKVLAGLTKKKIKIEAGEEASRKEGESGISSGEGHEEPETGEGVSPSAVR